MDGVYNKIMILSPIDLEVKWKAKHVHACVLSCVYFSLLVSLSLTILLFRIVKSYVYSSRSNVWFYASIPHDVPCERIHWFTIAIDITWPFIDFDHALIYRWLSYRLFCILALFLAQSCHISIPKTFKYSEQVFNELINSLHFIFKIDEKSGNILIRGSLMWQWYLKKEMMT